MIKTTTQNEVILNLYQETSSTSLKAFETECLLNSTLSQERDDFQALKEALEGLTFSPRRLSIERILKYSQSFMKSC